MKAPMTTSNWCATRHTNQVAPIWCGYTQVYRFTQSEPCEQFLCSRRLLALSNELTQLLFLPTHLKVLSLGP
jgi:hypothetical protein